MPPSRDVSPRGFFVRYGSRRALDADHAAYLAHGGMVVPVESSEAPAPDAPVQLRVETPGGHSFCIRGKVRRHVPGRGLMVAFDDGQPERDALDTLVESQKFRAEMERESPAFDPPETGTYTPEAPAAASGGAGSADPATAWGAASPPEVSLPESLFEEPTPIDPPLTGPVDNMPPLAAEPMPSLTADLVTGAGPEDGTALHPDVATAAPPRRPAPTADRPPTVIRAPRGGESYHVAVIKLFQIRDLVESFRRFFTHAELDVEYANAELTRGQIVRLRLTLPGHNVFEMWSVVEAVSPRQLTLRVNEKDELYRKAILYPESVAAKARLQREAKDEIEASPMQVMLFTEQKAQEDEEKMPLRRRLARMGMDDKINLALSGNREERMALAMDSNKAVHHYLLKNAKLTLDEIAFMARLPSLNPDVLDKIAENPAYTQNPTVVKALVFNPRTPVRTSIRLLDRLPRNELMNLSKRMSMNQRLVMAAKNKLFKVR